MHNMPGMEQGQILFREGACMASSDRATLVFEGCGGHGAMPHLATDPTVVAASTIMALQSIVARNVDPLASAVITVGRLQAGQTYNVIPETAELELSIRALKPEVRDLLEERIRAVAQGQADSFGAQCHITYERGYPVLVNSPAETRLAMGIARSLFGDARVIANADPLCASEDFAYMLEERPGCYLFIGNGDNGHTWQRLGDPAMCTTPVSTSTIATSKPAPHSGRLWPISFFQPTPQADHEKTVSTFRRHAFVLSFASLCVAPFAMGAARAADLRVVTLLVPYPAGGLSDSIARAISAALGRALNQQVIVDNLGGVSGSLAAQKVLNAPADGHMIFLGSPNEVILSPMVNAAVKLRAEDFRMLGQVAVNPLVLLTRSTLPVRNVDEFIAYAKTQDKGLSYGSVGMGSMYHLLAESMAQQTQIHVTHVPYKGMAPMVQDVGGNSIDFAILPYATSFKGMSEQGRLRLIGWLAPTRSEPGYLCARSWRRPDSEELQPFHLGRSHGEPQNSRGHGGTSEQGTGRSAA